MKKRGRGDPKKALPFWKEANEKQVIVTPLPFSTVIYAVLLAQTISTSAEKVFSDFARMEGNQRQSLDPRTLEMSEIHIFVHNELSRRFGRPLGASLMHPDAQVFRGIVDHVVLEVSEQLL